MQRPIENKKILPGGKIGKLTDNVINRWLIGIDETNPAILDMFEDAGRKPLRVLMAWSGEFAGKYLTGAALLYSMTRNEKLGKYLKGFVKKLCSLQKSDGYFGTWGNDFRFKSESPVMHYVLEDPSDKKDVNWDVWNHYHMIIGLITWSDASADEGALESAMRAADLLCNVFYTENGKKVSDVSSPESNMAVIHAFTQLYKRTKIARYFDFALKCCDDFKNTGDYLRCGIRGDEFFETPVPRWESLHSIEALADLYEITGDEKYRSAAVNLWESMTRTDLHNTYGFSTDEKATGSPFEKGAVETCCTVAYMALTADILRITGDARCADVLEKCTFNSGIASISPSGRWSTYDTPVEGYKRANYHHNGWQSRPGSPDLNCCSVNAPRAIGILNDWAFTEEDGTLVINYLGECCAELSLADGTKVKVTEKTSYPYDGKIEISLESERKTDVKIRIPAWSNSSVVYSEGKKIGTDSGYVFFKSFERAVLELDMTPRFTVGEKEFSDRISIARGPLVLCLDSAFCDDFFPIPSVDPRSFKITNVKDAKIGGCLFECEANGLTLTLCDLYTAGVSGLVYTTWLSCEDISPAEYSSKTLERSFSL